MTLGLSVKQRAFIDYFIELGNATLAAEKAGYRGKNLNRIASQNLSNQLIKEELDKRLKEIASKRIATAEEVLNYLTRVLRGEETEQVVMINGSGEIKVINKELSAKDRIKAGELLGKRYRLFIDKEEQNNNLIIKFEGENELE